MRPSHLASIFLTVSLLVAQAAPLTAQNRFAEIADKGTTEISVLSPPVDELWVQFRRTFPYHIQTLAYDRKTRTLIISEPPPHVTEANLKEALRRYNQDLDPVLHVMSKGIGVDGWVKDIVLELPPMDEAKTRDALDAVQQYLFYTTYKSRVMSLPAEKPALNSSTLDLNVSLAEINKWLFEENERFSPLLGGESETANGLLTRKKSGVFFSKERGLVAWSIDRNKLISDSLVEARQFALDSDIVVGAVSSGSQILVLGRERTIPVDILPPLRGESIMLVASVKDNELSQSYERNHIFAGRFNGTEDWAPIYLSDALVDTEYGSLLNITDQLLKGWSNNGVIKYANFDYPNPTSWSKKWCFDTPLMLKAKKEKGAGSVTFNWNTKGVGYTTKIDTHEVFALNRSGSLPTSYLVGDEEKNVNEYEETGYKCFATFGDPNLARVVQYAALYQIFQSYPVKGDAAFVRKPAPPPRDVLTDNAERALRSFAIFAIMGSDNQQLSPEIRKILSSYRDQLVPIINAFGNDGTRALSQAIAHPRLSESEEQQLRRTLDQIQKAGNDKSSFATALAQLTRNQQIKLMAYFISQELLDDDLARDLILRSGKIEIAKVKDDYVATSARDTKTWIRTPSVVVSRIVASGDTELGRYIGGHDLKAATTRFEPSANVQVGKVRITQRGNRVVYEYNPADFSKVQRLVRDAAAMTEGRRITPELLTSVKARLEGDLVPPAPGPRSRSEALLSPAGGTRLEADRGLVAKQGSGWKPEPLLNRSEANKAQPLSGYGDVAVFVERQVTTEGFEFDITAADGKVIKAYSTPSAVDAVADLGRNAIRENPKVAFRLKGFTGAEAQGFLFNTDLRLRKSSLAGFVERTGNGIEPVSFRTAAADYNLLGVDVNANSIGRMAEGRYKGFYELRVGFDLPARVAAKPSLKIRLQMLYRSAISDPTITGVKNAVRNFLSKPISPDAKMNAVIFDLANELRAINPNSKNILTVTEEDALGIIIVELRPLQNKNGDSKEGNRTE